VYKQYGVEWTKQLPPKGYSIPMDYKGANTLESERLDCVYWPIPVEKLQPEGKPSNTIRIYDCIWLAMHNVISNWTGNEQVVINERSVGRDIYMDKNLFKSLGFYVVDHPVSTKMSANLSIREGLLNVRDALSDGSYKGAIYNYLCDNNNEWTLPHEASPMRHDFHGREDSKTYFGGIQFYSGRTRFVVANGELDLNVSVNLKEGIKNRDRLYFLDFSSIIINQELLFGIYYSKNIHSPRTIRNLGDAFVREMDRITDYLQAERIRCIY
jgi:hypothetical protein